MTTYCTACDLIHPDTAKLEPWRRRCMAVRTSQGFRYVDPDYAPSPPYELASRVNTEGNCEFFTPKRVAPEEVK